VRKSLHARKRILPSSDESFLVCRYDGVEFLIHRSQCLASSLFVPTPDENSKSLPLALRHRAHWGKGIIPVFALDQWLKKHFSVSLTEGGSILLISNSQLHPEASLLCEAMDIGFRIPGTAVMEQVPLPSLHPLPPVCRIRGVQSCSFSGQVIRWNLDLSALLRYEISLREKS